MIEYVGMIMPACHYFAMIQIVLATYQIFLQGLLICHFIILLLNYKICVNNLAISNFWEVLSPLMSKATSALIQIQTSSFIFHQ